MSAVDCLVNYKMTSSPTPTQKGKGQKHESSWKMNPKAFKKSGGRGWKKTNSHAKVGERATSSQVTKPSGCFIYDGPHQARDCLRKEKLNAIIVDDGETSKMEAPMRASPL